MSIASRPRASQSRVALFAIAAVAAAACSGCFGAAALTTMAPMVASGAAQVVGASVAMKESKGGMPSDDASERCDELLRTPIGVDEIRKTKDGAIETRHWSVAQYEGEPAWILTKGNPKSEDSWQPSPDIAKRNFKPPLFEMLEPDKPQYVAYAPADVQTPQDSEQFETMTSAFGPSSGAFQWHDRPYNYVLAKELPCFKPKMK